MERLAAKIEVLGCAYTIIHWYKSSNKHQSIGKASTVLNQVKGHVILLSQRPINIDFRANLWTFLKGNTRWNVTFRLT